MLELDFATATTAKTNELSLHRAPWPQLAARMSRHRTRDEKDGPLIVFAKMAMPVRRAENVLAVTAVALDVDGKNSPPPPVEVAIARIQHLGLAAALWTTFSHRITVPRYRIVLPFDQPLPAIALPIALQATAQALGLEEASDAVCRDAARCFYTAACPAAHLQDSTSWWTDGPPLAAAPFVESAHAHARREKARRALASSRQHRSTTSLLDRARAAIQGAGEGNRNATANRWSYIAGRAAAAGEIDVHQAEDVLLHAAQAAGLAKREASYTVRRALRQGGGL